MNEIKYKIDLLLFSLERKKIIIKFGDSQLF